MTTCFFCQNLLSDYIEGILPAMRHEELKAHLDQCPTCQTIQKDLKSTVDLLHDLPEKSLSPELKLRILETSSVPKSHLGRWVHGPKLATARWIGISSLALLLVVLSLLLPRTFPWFTAFHNPVNDSEFVRYHPLSHGASEIIDEQSTWLGSHGPTQGSVWDEGGLTPQEFEKAFEKPAEQVPPK